MVKKLRKRYKAAKLEIEDCTKEFATQKQELLDIVRFQEKDMKFSDKLIEIMLSKGELYKLRQKANWNDDTQQWQIPLFIFNAKQGDVAFPTINAKTRVEQSKDDRELNFADENNGSPSRRSARKWQGEDASPRYENESIEDN